MLKIVTNYTPRSHVLCGEALKDVYASFRLEVLRVEEWSTWHPKMAPIPGGKGWCIRKANFDDLVAKLAKYEIPYEVVEYSGPSNTTKKREKKQKKGPKNAYAFFAKEKWTEARDHLPIEYQKNMSKISKEVSKMWKEVVAISKDTQWHQQALREKTEFQTKYPLIKPDVIRETFDKPTVENSTYTEDTSLKLETEPKHPMEDSEEEETEEEEEGSYKEIWSLYPHEVESFPFCGAEESGKGYNLWRFMFEKSSRHDEQKGYRNVLSFKLACDAIEEEMYKKAWELAVAMEKEGLVV